MEELSEKILGFLPEKGIFWTSVGLFFFMIVTRSSVNWFREKVKLPWMEPKNVVQRMVFEKKEGEK